MASYVVSGITDCRVNGRSGKFDYLVSWQGYDDPTWESESNCEECIELIEQFHRDNPK